MRRLALLIAAGSLWLFLAAVPALADGGPHVASVNSGTSSLTADSCAGCHRAHSAQGEYLLTRASEEALCLSCHGALGIGATTNVEDGVQYTTANAGLWGTGGVEGTVLGALRDGGFLNARIGASAPSRMSYPRGYEDGPYNTTFAVSTRPKVPVGASEPVRSAHIDVTPGPGDGIADTGRIWGSGLSGQLGTASVTLECVDCHNPHGNNTYRILRDVPGTETDPLGAPTAYAVKATYTGQDYIVTATQHGLVTNDEVTLTGVGGLTGTYFVFNVVNGFTFQVAAATNATAAADLTNTTGTGTVVRKTQTVADSPVDPDGNGSNPTKNYTIIQTKGVQGTDSTFLLYARDVQAAAAGTGSVAVASTPIAITSTTAAIGTPATVWIQTTGATGVAVGDLVTVAGTAAANINPGSYTVGAIRSSGTVYDQFTLIGVTPTASQAIATLTISRDGLTGGAYAYGPTAGDYFRRTVPWNPALANPGCLNTVFSTTNSAYCGTMNDAPNGRPAAVTNSSQGGRPSAMFGQKAFLDEMSTWCATCHTRYYQNSNENPGSMAASSTLSNVGIGRMTASNERIYSVVWAATGSAFPVPGIGDKVTFAGTGTALDADGAGPNTDEWFVVSNSSTSGYFSVSATNGGAAFNITADAGDALATPPYSVTIGTFTRTYQSSASGWWFPRNVNGVEDADYKYQHSTASNRACTVCHVGHGSNATATGQNGTTFSNQLYPDGVTRSTSSRLLKVDNRGTCQLCHDPTGTVVEGTLLGGNTAIP